MVCPPLIVTDDQLDEIMQLLVESLDAFAFTTGLPVNGS
jgi:adenosylmethionine-8-amino-7-oxononanoate aminotransferase